MTDIANFVQCDAKPQGCVCRSGIKLFRLKAFADLPSSALGTQCARARRTCPGYRKEEDLLFRNENEKVALKVTSREKQRLPATDTNKSTAKVGLSEIQPNLQQDLIAAQLRRFRQLSLTINHDTEELAECYFATNFMTGLERPSFGFVQRLLALYKLQANDEHLLRSFRAVGLASLAYRVHDVSVLNASHHEYVKAIQLTNLSLKSPIDATKDSTLISTLLLGMFEVITACSSSSLEAWAHHIQGAAALIRLRGHDQTQTREGCELFLQATSGLLNACMQRQLPLPEGIIEMTEKIYSSKVFGDVTPEQIATCSLRLAFMKFNQFRASLGADSTIDVESASIQALAIDRTIALISSNPPTEWQYEMHFTETASRDIVFEGRYHVYPSIRAATIWNHLRGARCLIHISILKLLLLDRSRLFPTLNMESYMSQLRSSIDVIRKLQFEILASVPHALGFVKRTDFGGYEITKTHGTRAGDGYFVMWSLFTVGVNVVKSRGVEEYCIRWLKFVGEEMGVQQALVLARAIETRTMVFPSSWGMMQMNVFKDLPESEHPSSMRCTYGERCAREAMDDDIRGYRGATARYTAC